MPTLIRQRYELLETLGAGGEARVVKALDRQHDRFVALKIRRVRDGLAREELLNEARVLLALAPHEALPLVREDFFDGDDYVVAMDWVDGTDLATLLRQRGRPGLAPSSVLEYLAEAAEALTHLHAHDPPIIHGDIKPDNLILTKGGRVKLVDFGMSSAPNGLRRRTGTPGYRAPELAAHGSPSRVSDIYALAATAFALLTGSAPAGVLPAWQGIDPAQAEQLENAIRAGMATDPSRRPTTPGELVERLRVGWAEALPTGVITFCLSDIEDSTAMWDADPVAMAAALVRHDELIADCAEAQGGRLLKAMGEGDSTVSVFDSATSALHAALAATRALSTEPWPGGLHVVARFGLHTGKAERRGADYRGPSVNFAARLRAQADGGQIFLSSVTTELVAQHLPEGCSLVDLGPHRLRGLRAPERIQALKGPGVSAPLSVTQCPYRGLLPFEPEDRDYFFGREKVVEELLGRLRPGRLLAVVGASGSGKSSVLRAGVVAAVRSGEVPGIERARLLAPGSSPHLAVEDDAAQLLVVDQFEELFTLCDDPARREAFIEALLAVHDPVAIGVRADVYGKLGAHPELARAVAANQVLLGSMTDEELERAVREPARLAGLRVEPGLVELAVREVSDEPGALPLLSHALRATWERRDGRTLIVEGYRESGGVAAALARTADDLIRSLPAERRQLTRNVFLRLTELGEGTGETRRRATIAELAPQGVSPEVIDALLKRLADARLVTLGEGTAEVAHEVLIREWPTLRGWLEEDRDGIRLHRQLGHAAHIWEAGGRDPSDLYRGTRLGAAVDWAELHREDLNATERSFIEASRLEAEHEARRQHTQNRRLRSLLLGVGVLLVFAIVAGIVALVNQQSASQQAQKATTAARVTLARQLGAEAVNEPQLDVAMLLAREAVNLDGSPQTEGTLLATLQRNPEVIGTFALPVDLAAQLALSPDGRTLAVSHFLINRYGFVDNASLGDIRFYDPRTHAVKRAPVTHFGGAEPPVYSSNGSLLAYPTDSLRASIAVRDAHTLALRTTLTLNPFQVAQLTPDTAHASILIAPDGRTVYCAYRVFDLARSFAKAPGATYLARWSLPSGRLLSTTRIDSGAVLAVRLIDTGTRVLVVDSRGVSVFDSNSVRRLRSVAITPALAAPSAAAISPDGRAIAVGSQTGRVSFVDPSTGDARPGIGAQGSAVTTVAYTRDGRTVATTGTDNRVIVWDAHTARSAEVLTAPAEQVQSVAFSPDGTTLYTSSLGGVLLQWDLTGQRSFGRRARLGAGMPCCGPVSPLAPPLALSPDGTKFAVRLGTSTVGLFSARTLQRLTSFTIGRKGTTITALAWSPTRPELAVAGYSGLVQLWRVDGAPRLARSLTGLNPLLGQPTAIQALAFSPDGQLLAASDSSEAVEQTPGATLVHYGNRLARLAIWRTSDGTLLAPPLDLGTGHGRYGALAFSRDGRLLAVSVPDGSDLILDPRTRQVRHTVHPLGADDTVSLAFAAGGTLATGTQGGIVQLWNSIGGTQVAGPAAVAAGPVTSVAFDPSGQRFATTGGQDGTVKLWATSTLHQEGTALNADPGITTTAAFEPGGSSLLVVNDHGKGFTWPASLSAWEQRACAVAGRNMSHQEWARYLPGLRYTRVCP